MLIFIERGYQQFNVVTSVGIRATWLNQIAVEDLSLLRKIRQVI